MKALFKCTSKTGIETFSVNLEPVIEAVTPPCPVCGNTTHEDFCTGDSIHLAPHKPIALEEGDTSFFKDLPHGSIFLSPLTKEAADQFEEGAITEISFKLIGRLRRASAEPAEALTRPEPVESESLDVGEDEA